MVSEWKKSALEKLKERESEACASFVKNLTRPEKEREAAIKSCIINIEKLPLEKRIEFIQEINECKKESHKATTPKVKEEFENWCYAWISIEPPSIKRLLPVASVPTFEAPQPLVSPGAGKWKCNWVLEDGSVCPYSTNIKSNFDRHIRTAHSEERPYKCDRLLEDGSVCPWSSRGFKTKKDLDEHIIRAHSEERPFKCDQLLEDGSPCPYSITGFKTKKDLNQHIQRLHSEEGKPYKCDQLLEDGSLCPYSITGFRTKKELDRHIKTAHSEERPYKCDQLLEDGSPCPYSITGFKLKGDLTQHIKTAHSEERPYKCDQLLENGSLCPYSSKTQNKLKEHIESHHKKLKKYKCDRVLEDGSICPASFQTWTGLDQHIKRAHTEGKPYKCDQLLEDGSPCPYSITGFKTIGDLRQHIRAVHSERKFFCDQLMEDDSPCPYSVIGFATKAALKSHIELVHLKLRKYICTWPLETGKTCGQDFQTKRNLTEHIKVVHKGEVYAICDWEMEDGNPCGAPIKRQSDYKRHIDMVHKGIKPYPCSVCGSTFVRSDARDHHQKSCIGETDASLASQYHITKGYSVENTVLDIIEEHCKTLPNVVVTRQKVLHHPGKANVVLDMYCEGLEGKRIGIDVTTANTKQTIIAKWTEKQYQSYPKVDELWVILVANEWDERRCDHLTYEAHKKRDYLNVFVYHWSDLRNIKMMSIPPKIWELLGLFEKCTLSNREECKAYWEEAKEKFHTL